MQTWEASCFLYALAWLYLICSVDLNTCGGNLWDFQICVSQDEVVQMYTKSIKTSSSFLKITFSKNSNSTTSTALQEKAAELDNYHQENNVLTGSFQSSEP